MWDLLKIFCSEVSIRKMFWFYNPHLNPSSQDRVLSTYCLRVISYELRIIISALLIKDFNNFFPSNAFLRRRRKKALLRVNDRGGGWRMCILALCRVCVRVYVCVRALMSHARLQLTYVAMAILRKRSQFMI